MLRCKRLKPPPQRAAIGCRIGQAIDMIDPEAIDDAFGIEPENQRVHALECFCVLHAQADELVDIKKTSPVDLVVRHTPPRQTVVLTSQQLEKTRAALRAAGVELCQ